MNDAGLRHENKYEISMASAAMLRARLKTVALPDAHHGLEGYQIHSLYFDDMDYGSYRDKIDGIRDRSKLRLRYYNNDLSYIVFENKEKLGNLTRKTSMTVSKETADAMIHGDPITQDHGELIDLFNALRLSRKLQPKVLVDYHRTAFTVNVQNVRITLDERVQTLPFKTDLFDRELPMIQVLDPGTAILEVKYDEFLPPYLAMVLNDVPMTRVAVSKFVRCLSILE